MGLFSSIGKQIKRAGRDFDKEFNRELSDVVNIGTLGTVNLAQIKKLKKEEERNRAEQKKIQAKQRRSSILDDAEFSNELALRKNISKKGGRVGLLTRSGEAGSLLA